jgi:two-component sensor histidine kinase
MWTCTVADDGTGLPADPSDREGGGLSFVRQLVSGLDGELRTASRTGRGTSMQVRFRSPARQ